MPLCRWDAGERGRDTAGPGLGCVQGITLGPIGHGHSSLKGQECVGCGLPVTEFRKFRPGERRVSVPPRTLVPMLGSVRAREDRQRHVELKAPGF